MATATDLAARCLWQYNNYDFSTECNRVYRMWRMYSYAQAHNHEAELCYMVPASESAALRLRQKNKYYLTTECNHVYRI